MLSQHFGVLRKDMIDSYSDKFDPDEQTFMKAQVAAYLPYDSTEMVL